MASRSTFGLRVIESLFGREQVQQIRSAVQQGNDRLARLEESIKDLNLTAGEREGIGFSKSVRHSGRPPIATISYNKPKGQRQQFTRDQGLVYEPAQYPLAEIARVRDIESMFQTAIERHCEMALQEGWFLQGRDPQKVNYVYKRFWEMGLLSERSMTLIFSDIFYQLAAYGTALIVARRDKDRSSGRPIKYFGKKLTPIATLHVADAPTMSVAENKRGVPVSWRQQVRKSAGSLFAAKSESRTFNGFDVFPVARSRQPGMVFGTPMVISVLDDIMSLRRLEELADIIPQKHLFPVFQVLVGTDLHPAKDMDLADGSKLSEIEYAKQEIEEMPTEGGFVTSHRWKFELIGAKDKVLDIQPFLEYFRQRVQHGLRLNDTIVGSSGSDTKSTATHQMKALADSARSLHVFVQEGFRPIILQILMEGGFDVTWDDEVVVKFERPDVEQRMAEENHEMAQYQGEMRSHTEAREAMGYEKFGAEQEKESFLQRQHMREMETAKVQAASRAQSASGKKAKASAKSTSVRNQPRNQSGKKSSKTRVKKNDAAEE